MFPLISVEPRSVEPLLGIVCVVVRVNKTPVEKRSVVVEIRLPVTENVPSELVVVRGADGTALLPGTPNPAKEISTLTMVCVDGYVSAG